MTNQEFSNIKKLIEEGGKTLNDCSDYFKRINPNLLNLVSFMNREFVDFNQELELLKIIKDDSFKQD
jgi:hypothetical protein